MQSHPSRSRDITQEFVHVLEAAVEATLQLEGFQRHREDGFAVCPNSVRWNGHDDLCVAIAEGEPGGVHVCDRQFGAGHLERQCFEHVITQQSLAHHFSLELPDIPQAPIFKEVRSARTSLR